MQEPIEKHQTPPLSTIFHDFIIEPSSSNIIKLYEFSREPVYAQYIAQAKSNYQNIKIQHNRILDFMLTVNFMLGINRELSGPTAENINELLALLGNHSLDNSNRYAFLLWHLAGKILMAIDYEHIIPSQIILPDNLINSMPDIFFSMQFYHSDDLKRLCFLAAAESCFRISLKINSDNLEVYLILAESILHNYSYMIQEKLNQFKIIYSFLSLNHLAELKKQALQTFASPSKRRVIFNTFDNIALKLSNWLPVYTDHPFDRFIRELDFYKNDSFHLFPYDQQIMENSLESCGYSIRDLPHIIPTLKDLEKIIRGFNPHCASLYINEFITDYDKINEQIIEGSYGYKKHAAFSPYSNALMEKWLTEKGDLQFFLGLIDNSCSNWNRYTLFLRLSIIDTIKPHIKKLLDETPDIVKFAKVWMNEYYTSNPPAIHASPTAHPKIEPAPFSPPSEACFSTPESERYGADNREFTSNLIQYSIFSYLDNPDIPGIDDIGMSFGC